MGYFSDYKDGLTKPSPNERDAMDKYGLDPDCIEDRARWRWMNADQPEHPVKKQGGAGRGE